MERGDEVIIFEDDDAGYSEWVAVNPDGFVLNSKRNLAGRSSMIHRANCPHIRSLRNGAFQKGFTSGGGIKYCSNDLHRIVHAIARDLDRPLFRIMGCRRCSAIEMDIVIERMPEEVENSKDLCVNGMIRVNPNERDHYLRSLVMARYGNRCVVCSVDLERTYGVLGRNALVTHQTNDPNFRSFSNSEELRLIPVCPNCHHMLHRGRETPLRVEELKRIITRTRVKEHGSKPIGASGKEWNVPHG